MTTSLDNLPKNRPLYLCVNQDGTELASNDYPHRAEECIDNLNKVFNGKYETYRKSCIGKWSTDYSTGIYTVPVFGGVVLPQGTIEKLTGKKMTWEDEPFELKNL